VESTIGLTELSAMQALVNTDVSEGNKTFNGSVRVVHGLSAFGASPPTTQPVAIANPTGGTTTDAEARTAVTSILAVLRAAGLIAT